MTSATIAPRGNAPPANIHVVQHGPIVVATDGSIACDAAQKVAGRLAELHDSKVVVLSAVEPVVVVPMDFGIVLPYSDIEQAQMTERVTKVLAQLERVGARDAGWTMRIEYGEPAYAIATAAQDLDATMVITGLGHHALLDRVLGGETALRIVRASKSPVLAVTGRNEELPRRAGSIAAVPKHHGGPPGARHDSTRSAARGVRHVGGTVLGTDSEIVRAPHVRTGPSAADQRRDDYPGRKGLPRGPEIRREGGSGPHRDWKPWRRIDEQVARRQHGDRDHPRRELRGPRCPRCAGIGSHGRHRGQTLLTLEN